MLKRETYRRKRNLESPQITKYGQQRDRLVLSNIPNEIKKYSVLYGKENNVENLLVKFDSCV
jgi:hypothetical protein